VEGRGEGRQPASGGEGCGRGCEGKRGGRGNLLEVRGLDAWRGVSGGVGVGLQMESWLKLYGLKAGGQALN
jgi:hypothetical protein